MAKIFTLVLGLVLLGVGVVGWLTGGHDHELIIFGINMTHNLVHILSGVLGLIAVFAGAKYTKIFLLVFGIVYGLVTVGGFLNLAPVVSMLNLNMADNGLHLLIAVGCLFVGITDKSA